MFQFDHTATELSSAVGLTSDAIKTNISRVFAKVADSEPVTLSDEEIVSLSALAVSQQNFEILTPMLAVYYPAVYTAAEEDEGIKPSKLAELIANLSPETVLFIALLSA